MDELEQIYEQMKSVFRAKDSEIETISNALNNKNLDYGGLLNKYNKMKNDYDTLKKDWDIVKKAMVDIK